MQDDYQSLIGTQYGSVIVDGAQAFPSLNSEVVLVTWHCPVCGDAGIRRLDDLQLSTNSICFCNQPRRQSDYDLFIGHHFASFTILDVVRVLHMPTKAVWLCDCGNYGVSGLSQISIGKTKSCGSGHHHDYSSYVGMKIGRLTVRKIYFYPNRYNSGTRSVQIAVCECDCGRMVEVPFFTFREGRIRSCGCLLTDSVRKKRKEERLLNQYQVIQPGLVLVKTSNRDCFFYSDLLTWEYLKRFTWLLDSEGYIFTSIDRSSYKYHQLILANPNPSLYVRDHIDRNRLNNTYDNLRIITHRDNAKNHSLSHLCTSGYSGVSRRGNGWLSRYNVVSGITESHKFQTKEEAITHRLVMEATYGTIVEVPTQRLVNPDGRLNMVFPFESYPTFPWYEIGLVGLPSPIVKCDHRPRKRTHQEI